MPAVGKSGDHNPPMIAYRTSVENLQPEEIGEGFFEGWPNPPSREDHLRILKGSFAVVLAEDQEKVVGFITAISDGVSCAYIPHLEVLPAYRGHGIGSQLVTRLREQLKDLYMIDLLCDDPVKPFYKSLGFREVGGMAVRNYDRQSCQPNAIS